MKGKLNSCSTNLQRQSNSWWTIQNITFEAKREHYLATRAWASMWCTPTIGRLKAPATLRAFCTPTVSNQKKTKETLSYHNTLSFQRTRVDTFFFCNLPRRQRPKPGPMVTATAERSFSVKLALSSASCTTWNRWIHMFLHKKKAQENETYGLQREKSLI